MSQSIKNKIYFSVLTVGLILIAGGLFWKEDIGKIKEKMMKAESLDQSEEKTPDQDSVVSRNYLEGVLYSSDNEIRGNLKIVSREGDIYVRTARDFSKLVGLQVLALINGALENFELLDIQPAVQKDGFILPQ